MACPGGQPLNILAIGAHPDDCDSRAGGAAALFARVGHRVKFVSLTNGDAGHHEVSGPGLAARRHAEAQAAARVLGLVEYQILDHHDGGLEPTLANRREVIRIIRMHCHTSQMYEWLPYNANRLAEVPADEAGRRAWLARWRLPVAEAIANRHRDLLIALYGRERGERVRYAEAFEGCEYGTRLTPESIPRLFPFFAAGSEGLARG